MTRNFKVILFKLKCWLSPVPPRYCIIGKITTVDTTLEVWHGVTLGGDTSTSCFCENRSITATQRKWVRFLSPPPLFQITADFPTRFVTGAPNRGNHVLNPSYLTLSDFNVYHLRWPMPRALSQGKRRYIKLSLETRDPTEALLLAKAMSYHAATLIQQGWAQGMDILNSRGRIKRHRRPNRTTADAGEKLDF